MDVHNIRNQVGAMLLASEYAQLLLNCPEKLDAEQIQQFYDDKHLMMAVYMGRGKGPSVSPENVQKIFNAAKHRADELGIKFDMPPWIAVPELFEMMVGSSMIDTSEAASIPLQGRTKGAKK